MMLVYRQMLERYWDLMSSTSDWSCGCDLTCAKIVENWAILEFYIEKLFGRDQFKAFLLETAMSL